MRSHLVLAVLSLSAGCPGPTDDKAPEEEPEETGCELKEEAPFYASDRDCDGYASVGSGGTDCDDNDDAIYPGADEACNSVDDDCDGEADEDVDGIWYRDEDGDGWGDESREACAPSDGYVEVGGDCDDGDPDVSPDGTEICDGADNDCDGEVDGTSVAQTWYKDRDGDGYGDPDTEAYGCFPEEDDLVGVAGDCDDGERDAYEGHPEECDGLDNDCDGDLLSDEVDDDYDGQLVCEGDCDDAEPLTRAGNREICGDGIDNDCEGTADLDCYDCDTTVTEGSSLQAAIRAASSGDTLCVGPGDWSGTLDFDGAAISVVSLAGPSETFLERVSFTSSDEGSSLLEGFTISGGSASEGGCVAIRGASATLVDLVVEDCGAPYGGGIYVEDGSLTIVGSILRGNTAYSPDFSDSSFGFGGGIALYDSDAVLEDLTFEDNFAQTAGGGLFVNSSTATLRHVVMKDNVANYWSYWPEAGGGGLMVAYGSAALENVLIVDNSTGWPDHGGGVDAYESELTLTNVTIADNSASYGVGGGLALIASEATLTNTIVSGNEASYGGGGLDVYEESTVTLRYSDVWGNDPDDYDGVTDPTGTDGNVSVDPEFLDDTYHLAGTSPLIDAGDPDLLDPDGSPSDIGAWGGPEADGWDLDGDGYNSWWQPGAYDAATSPELDCDDGDDSVYPGRGC